MIKIVPGGSSAVLSLTDRGATVLSAGKGKKSKTVSKHGESP